MSRFPALSATLVCVVALTIDFDFGGSVPSGPSPPYDDGSAGRAAYEKNAAAGRAAWSGDPGLAERQKAGQCTWSDVSRNGGC